MVPTVRFTSVNWNIPQTVTVRAVQDEVTEGNHTQLLTHTTSSDEAAFDGLPASDVLVNIIDDDIDTDRDGIPDSVEDDACTGVMPCVPTDTDGDGTPDFRDPDAAG